MTTATIPKRITRGEELIILPRKEYEKLLDLSKRIRKTEPINKIDMALKQSMEEIKQGKVFGPFNTAKDGIKFLKSE